MVSQPGIEPPTTPFSLGIFPLSPSSLGSSHTKIDQNSMCAHLPSLSVHTTRVTIGKWTKLGGWRLVHQLLSTL
jgi:hypothetical protein